MDLQPRYPDYVEYSDDEEEDKVIKWDFNHPCNQCGKDINVYHRYYYKCADSCDYVLHKSCAKKLPATLITKSHSLSHKFFLTRRDSANFCFYCRTYVHDELYYHCLDCPWWRDSSMHVKCAMAGRENHIIYHPSHPHPLQSGTTQPILCKCDACGKEHRGIFYHCTTCFDHTIQIECAFLPRKLQIQHTHPLIISYSSQHIVWGSTSFTCRICGAHFVGEYIWAYKCESCRYFVHLDCATSRTEPFMSIFQPAGKTIKNFKDADYPNLLNLPFPDQTYSVLRHWFSEESGSTTVETSERNLNHISHQHVLSLVGTQSNDSKGATTSSSVISVSCHDPMKRVELLCNGCVRPIMDVPFYKCSSEDKCCDFVLHEWCTRLPADLPNYPHHPQHSLIFLPKVPGEFFDIFRCENCELDCNGFAYGCTKCKYYIDVNCGFIPEEITHEAHSGHILSRSSGKTMKTCVAEDTKFFGSNISFSCRSCDFYLHSTCALFLPRFINHKLDKHPMKLTYGPVENHKSEYFCEVCEEKLNPVVWFYHCHACLYSLHTHCAPVIVNFENAVNDYGSLYKYLNIKFGGIYNIKGHAHSVLLAQGSDADGICPICQRDVINRIVIKCLKCKLAMHYHCCSRL